MLTSIKILANSNPLLILCLTVMSMSLSRGDEALPRSGNAAPVQEIRGETIQLTATPGKKWAGGTNLAHVQGKGVGKGLPVPRALLPSSVVVQKEDRVLTEGTDYVVNGIYSTLSLGPSPTVTPEDKITVSYKVGLRRIDSVIRLANGTLTLREGQPDITAPQPPALMESEKRVGNYFLDYFNTPEQALYFPCLELSSQAVTRTISRGLDRTLAKLKSGKPVTIVCWGDSVTTGAEASTPAKAYPQVFADRLAKIYPNSEITVKVIAVGASQSQQWLYPDKFPHPTAPKACRFEKVIDAKPDVVTIEFVNDAWLTGEGFNRMYGEILTRLKAIGAEVVLISPAFTMPEMMQSNDLKTKETRRYVDCLASFADTNHLAFADASSRWAHLWKEGIPYVTLLKNGINHPDDRGHRIFADELLECFSPDVQR